MHEALEMILSLLGAISGHPRPLAAAGGAPAADHRKKATQIRPPPWIHAQIFIPLEGTKSGPLISRFEINGPD